jgi:hypothetical protein
MTNFIEGQRNCLKNLSSRPERSEVDLRCCLPGIESRFIPLRVGKAGGQLYGKAHRGWICKRVLTQGLWVAEFIPFPDSIAVRKDMEPGVFRMKIGAKGREMVSRGFSRIQSWAPEYKLHSLPL